MNDYSHQDPLAWIGILALYIFPIFVCFFKCIKKKRKIIPSFLMSIFLPTTFWIAIITWFIGIMFSITMLGKAFPEWVAVTLSFIVVGGGLMYPLGYFQDFCANFYDNYIEREIFSIKRIRSEKN